MLLLQLPLPDGLRLASPEALWAPLPALRLASSSAGTSGAGSRLRLRNAGGAKGAGAAGGDAGNAGMMGGRQKASAFWAVGASSRAVLSRMSSRLARALLGARRRAAAVAAAGPLARVRTKECSSTGCNQGEKPQQQCLRVICNEDTLARARKSKLEHPAGLPQELAAPHRQRRDWGQLLVQKGRLQTCVQKEHNRDAE